MTKSRPAGPTLLQRFVAAGHLRYSIISIWAVALATVIPWTWALPWFAATMVAGIARGIVEHHFDRLPAGARTVAATLSCAGWAIAPLLSWFVGGPNGDILAAVFLGTGYFLVFTQMRAAPSEALIVSSPYTVVTAVILGSTVGQDGAWTVFVSVPVLAIALLVKVLITQIRDRELRAVVDRQAELIVELEQARDRANAASDAKSNFLAVISHELRTPMNGVLGAAQLLDHGDLSARDRTYVDIIRGSGESLLDLLNDLLDVSKMEAGKLDLHPQQIVLEDFYGRIIGPCRTQAEAKGLDLILRCEPHVPTQVLADPMRLGQVVQNLLSNAIKFTEVGEVTLTVSAMAEGAHAILSFAIEDTGAGIAPADIDKLFQPFQQLDDSSTRRFGGTGLGLTIARRIARQMNGDVVVSSTPGAGSTFTFTARLEIVPDQIVLEKPRVADERHGEAMRVLVVEDHPVNRMVLEAWLTSQGHQCSMAANGEEGLDAARSRAFDLILMDVNMPVMDGLTATRQLRATPGANQWTPVIILSASARPEDHEVGLAAGADAYLNKPIDFAQLALLLSQPPKNVSSTRPRAA
jgi:signal transduction histidine kinase/CheY-like chemotaxis protein